MSDDVGQLLSPGAITRVGQGLPRRDEPPPRKRRPPDAPRPQSDPVSPEDTPNEEPRLVGSRLNVRA